MRTLKEPGKVALEPLYDMSLERDEDKEARIKDFWSEFEYDLSFHIERLKDVNLAREWFKKHILDYLRTSVLRLRNGMADGVELWKWGDALQGRGSDCQGTSKDMGRLVRFHSHELVS